MADRRLLLLVIYLDILNFFHTGHPTYTSTFTADKSIFYYLCIFSATFFFSSQCTNDIVINLKNVEKNFYK